ncbi:hypothetical protein RND81_04G223500 [Saponaria officinalis]|uniref:Uncharacterized protein n=1 Tax=Saponaria officinalis TaxID=3572 RepID=A0AAW1LPP5_SAPOF
MSIVGYFPLRLVSFNFVSNVSLYKGNEFMLVIEQVNIKLLPFLSQIIFPLKNSTLTMDTGCGALVGKLDDVKLTLKNPREADDNNRDNDDSCDGAELLAAAEEGRGEDVLSILGKNPGLIQTGDPVGNTVLHMAAKGGDIVTVCDLIAFPEERQGKDSKKVLEDKNVSGDTALHLAIKNGHRKVAYHLIKAEEWTGFIRNNDGITPYKLAEKAGFSEVCPLSANIVFHQSLEVDARMEQARRDLMSKSRSIHVQWTELYKAIIEGEEDVLITGLGRDGKELLWHRSHEGETLLHTAVTAFGMGPLSKLVQFMIRNGLTDAALLGDRHGNTALHTAIMIREPSKVFCLIKAEPTAMYQVNDKGVSPLCLAVKYGHEDLVKLMGTQICLRQRKSEMLLNPKHATLAHLAIKERSLGTSPFLSSASIYVILWST